MQNFVTLIDSWSSLLFAKRQGIEADAVGAAMTGRGVHLFLL